MATGNLDVSGVASLGGSSYDLTVDSTTGVTVGDDVGCPLAAGGSGGYSVTAIPDGTSLTVSAKTDALGATFGAPGTTGTGADNAWFSTPDASGNVIVPESAPGGSWAWAEQLGSGSSTVLPGHSPGRLSLSSSDPLGEASGAGTIYFHRYKGTNLPIYDGSAWSYLPIAGTAVSVALSGGTASKPHDVFAYDSSGAIALELVAWTNDTTRATTLTRVDSVWTKTGDNTRRYLGSVYLDGSKQATFSVSGAQLDVWNVANQIQYATDVYESTSSWTYNTGTWRELNGSTNRIPFMQGLDLHSTQAAHQIFVSHSSGTSLSIGIGLDSVTSNSAIYHGAIGSTNAVPGRALYQGHPGEGYHYLAAIEIGAGAGTTTYYSGSYCGIAVASWH